MMEKGEYQPAEDLLRKALATFTELGETPSALDASVHLAECLLRQDRCSEALDLLDSASSTVSSESDRERTGHHANEIARPDQAGKTGRGLDGR